MAKLPVIPCHQYPLVLSLAGRGPWKLDRPVPVTPVKCESRGSKLASRRLSVLLRIAQPELGWCNLPPSSSTGAGGGLAHSLDELQGEYLLDTYYTGHLWKLAAGQGGPGGHLPRFAIFQGCSYPHVHLPLQATANPAHSGPGPGNHRQVPMYPSLSAQASTASTPSLLSILKPKPATIQILTLFLPKSQAHHQPSGAVVSHALASRAGSSRFLCTQDLERVACPLCVHMLLLCALHSRPASIV